MSTNSSTHENASTQPLAPRPNRSSGSVAASTDIRKRQVAIGVGNFMEWFDFAVYGYFAAIIGAQFFPSGDSVAEMLSALAVFAVGFVARPFGALILGPIGDKYGRKLVLVITVMGMGLTTTAIGLIPNYDTIGVAGPVLIVILRCLQGIMVGGEWSGAATYLGESAPSNRRAEYASLITVTAGAAFLTGTLLAYFLNLWMDAESLELWGWRIPFVLSFVMAILALFIRRNLEDTPVYEELQQRRAENPDMKVATREEKLSAFGLALAFCSVFGVSLYYFVTYANNHLATIVGMDRPTALLACSIGIIVYVLAQPVVGRWSDRHGRRPVLLGGTLYLAVFAIPIFLLLNTGEFWPVLLGLIILALGVAPVAVMNVTLLVEVFPASVRSTGAALGHSVAYAVLAGPGPLIAGWLIQVTDSQVSPAYYLLAVCTIAFLVLVRYLPETRGKDITEG